MPHTRFLFYEEAGGSLAAHVDLSRTDPQSNITSTHTFILYLSDCEKGGETILLQHIRCGKKDTTKHNTPEELERQKKYIEQQQEIKARKEQQRLRYGDNKEKTKTESEPEEPEQQKKAKTKSKKSKKHNPGGVLASVSPARGRLLVFPHLCPHEGGVVIDLPKTLIRGELY
jgi:sRNA-binding protein